MDSLYALRQQQVTCYIPRDQQTVYASPSCNLLLLTSLLRLSHRLNICFSLFSSIKMKLDSSFSSVLLCLYAIHEKIPFCASLEISFRCSIHLESNLCLLQNISVILKIKVGCNFSSHMVSFICFNTEKASLVILIYDLYQTYKEHI